jgi:hypothetical protein
MTQFDLFAIPTDRAPDTNPLLDLKVVLPDFCPKCRSGMAIIGPGKGPHVASLTCAGCRHHRGWLSKQKADFIKQIISTFGRPTEPIVIRGDGAGAD